MSTEIFFLLALLNVGEKFNGVSIIGTTFASSVSNLSWICVNVNEIFLYWFRIVDVFKWILELFDVDWWRNVNEVNWFWGQWKIERHWSTVLEVPQEFSKGAVKSCSIIFHSKLSLQTIPGKYFITSLSIHAF